MSFFVLVYDRAGQRLLDLREFSEDDRSSAETMRLAAQRKSLHEDLDQEIILFQASSREALERSHGSYFLSESELLDRAKEAAKAG
jgi:hypothetical protein